MRRSLALALVPLAAARAAEPAPLRPGTREIWAAEKGALRASWQKILGPFPAEPVPLAVEREPVEDFPTYTRRKISYAIEAGVREDAVLFLPKKAPAKAPAVVVFHPTLKAHYAQVAGYDSSVPDKMMGPHLAERGYVVLCPRCFIFDEGADYRGNVARMQARHPDWLGITRMAWDGRRAVDVLVSLPEVDAARIGVIGHSLGAKEALYAAAFDERVKAAVSSEGGIGLAQSNWHDVWYLGPGIKAPGFPRDHHELLALTAPRAFLLIGGGAADGEASRPFIEAARPVYELFGASQNLRFFNHGQGHRYPPEARREAEAFLDAHLKPRP